MEPDGQRIIEYRKAMSLPLMPKRMLVMGSGAIGTEFAYFYKAMGTDVTLIEYLDRIVPLEDEDISKQLYRIFTKNGIKIMTGSRVVSVEKNDVGIKAIIENANGQTTLEADVLLSAVGVSANIEGIGLEELGIKTEHGKILSDDFL